MRGRRALKVSEHSGSDSGILCARVPRFGQSGQFEVGPVELEFAVELQRDAGSKAGVRVMVMTGANDQESARGQVNRIKLTLTPIKRSGSPVLIGDVDV
jgi:hypothetical protein